MVKPQLLLSGLIFSSLAATSCYDRYNDRAETGLRAPARDQFIGSVYFTTGSSALSRAATTDLVRMANRMRERRYSASGIVVIGYSDARKSSQETSELGDERAQRVAVALDKAGVDLERIVIDSRGLRLTRPQDAGSRVDLYFENGVRQASVVYPVLIAFFLLSAFAVAVIIFRRR